MPNISYLTSDLRGLFKKYALFQWSEVHYVAFPKIKNHISEDVCLSYFITTKNVVLQVNVPKYDCYMIFFWYRLEPYLIDEKFKL